MASQRYTNIDKIISRPYKPVLTVIVEKDKKSKLFVGDIPGIVKCRAEGKTVDELRKNMKKVIAHCLGDRKATIKYLYVYG